MNGAADIPLPAAVLISVCLLAGASFTLVGAIGLVRLRSFYERVHAPTLGSSMGMGLILISSIAYFSISRGEVVLHEMLIAVFLTLTTPISLMLIVRAALARGGREGDPDAPRIDRSVEKPRGG